MNWEAEYNKLKHERDEVLLPLLRRALMQMPDEEPVYSDCIAPADANLPVIMTMCTPHERRQIAVSVKQRISSNGEWMGYRCKTYGKQWRPVFDAHTARSDGEVIAGKRKAKAAGRQRLRGMVRFLAYHVILVDAGHYPTETRNCCSHLCHVPGCLRVSHLIWSSNDDNWRRERMCNKQRKCACGLQPQCIFDEH